MEVSKTFPYVPYAGDGPSPSLDLDLLGVNGLVTRQRCLVDTGAEWSKMPLELGIRLGADLSLCLPTTSQTGGGVAEGEFWWSNSPDGCAPPEPRVRLLGLDVPIAPILSRHIEVIVLGRRDFLTSFRLAVDQRAQTFTLTPYDEPTDQWVAGGEGS